MHHHLRFYAQLTMHLRGPMLHTHTHTHTAHRDTPATAAGSQLVPPHKTQTRRHFEAQKHPLEHD